MDYNRAEDIKSVFEEIRALNSSRYRITSLTGQYPSSTIRLAHLMLTKKKIIKKTRRRLYEVLDWKRLEDMSKCDVEKIEKDMNRLFSKMNKNAIKYAKYKGRNAPLDVIRGDDKNEQ